MMFLRRITAWLAGLFLCGSAGWIVHSYSTVLSERWVPESRQKPEPAVEWVKVQTKDLEERIEFIGILVPIASYTIRARTTGYVAALPYDLADEIRPHDGKLPFVVALDDAASRMQLKSAEVAQQEAAIQFEVNQHQLHAAQRDHQRTLDMKTKRLVSDSEVEQSDATVKVAMGNLNLSKMRIKRAEIDAERSQLDLTETKLYAPSAGVVAERFVEIGDYAKPGDPLLTVMDIATVVCVIQVVERDYPRLRSGQQAEIRIESLGEKVFPGVVDRVAPALGEMGTATVHLAIDNPDFRLKPGMHGRVSVLVRKYQNALVVPTEALLQEADGSSLFVVSGAPPKVTRREVRIGITTEGYVQVFSGISGGERIVTAGSRMISDGQQVQTNRTTPTL